MTERLRMPERSELTPEHKRFIGLQEEADGYGCTLEYVGTRRMRGYVFKSCDTGPGGVRCTTLDEIDEELDNFRG